MGLVGPWCILHVDATSHRVYRSISLIRKRHPPWDDHRTLGLAWGAALSYERGTPVPILFKKSRLSQILDSHDAFLRRILPDRALASKSAVAGLSVECPLTSRGQGTLNEDRNLL